MMICLKKSDLRNAVACALLMATQAAFANGLSWSKEGPGSPDSGSGTDFSRSQIDLTLPLERRENRYESVRTDAHLDISEFRWSGTTALQSEYYWLSMPIEYRQKRGRSAEFTIRAEPGFMTDLNVLDGDSLAMNADLIGRVYQRSGTFWQFGLTVNREFGDYSPRPVLGMATKLTPDTEMLLGFPRTRIVSRWSDDLASFLYLRPAGGVWQEEITGLTGTYRASYTNWKLGVGGEFHWRGPLWISGELGQMRHRRVRATDDTGTEVVASPGDDAFWQVGIDLRY
ncbi:hypothetical protein ACQUQU_09170 [Thalassolituus sp. LLYu03]|uniref:hypothetical protein n=1 Tax=Thalassolituus sp. LLYu03 TaxID=3421656 RepID=UPI003D2E7511